MPYRQLPPQFFKSPTVDVARNLLGAYLIHDSPEGRTVGKIVETEAYLQNDPACHASRGKTKRNEPMFGPPGHAYIYFIYGMYYCFNVVTEKEGIGEAVLIRALEPIEGLDLMEERRRRRQRRGARTAGHQLCNGPAKAVIAMGITPHMNRAKLDDFLWIAASDGPRSEGAIHTCGRIGIKEGADLPLRFYLKGSPFISKK